MFENGTGTTNERNTTWISPSNVGQFNGAASSPSTGERISAGDAYHSLAYRTRIVYSFSGPSLRGGWNRGLGRTARREDTPGTRGLSGLGERKKKKNNNKNNNSLAWSTGVSMVTRQRSPLARCPPIRSRSLVHVVRVALDDEDEDDDLVQDSSRQRRTLRFEDGARFATLAR